jgi:hypothetical protein
VLPNLELVERPDKIFDERVEVRGADPHTHVRGLHVLAGVLARATARLADLVHQVHLEHREALRVRGGRRATSPSFPRVLPALPPDLRLLSAEQVAQVRRALAALPLLERVARIDLAGQPAAPNASARAFWNRSHGLVFIGANLPQLPPGRTYQV